MSLTNAEFEFEFLKALLADPYNPEVSVLTRLDLSDWTAGNRPMFSYFLRAYQKTGCLDAGAFIETATDHDMDPLLRHRILELLAEVQDVPFPLARMAQDMLRYKSEVLTRAKLEKALKGPSEALESTIKESLDILAGTGHLEESPTFASEWENLKQGNPILDAVQMEPRIVVGIPTIDEAIMALPGNVGVIAAKPSAGKSSFALQAAILTAKAGIGTMVLGLEMPREEIFARAAAHETGHDSARLLRGETPFIGAEPVWVKNLQVYSSIPKGSFEEVSKLIRAKAKRGIKTVFVDYWTLVTPPNTKNPSNTAYLLGEMSRGYKQIARETGMHIVLISQFNREVEDAERPSLSNLRETGQLEQDASWVIMLWTGQKEYLPKQHRDINIELQKNRGAERWVKTVSDFDPTNSRFIESKPRFLTDVPALPPPPTKLTRFQ